MAGRSCRGVFGPATDHAPTVDSSTASGHTRPQVALMQPCAVHVTRRESKVN